MIILDTKVVSEAMMPEPHGAARAWLNNQLAETLYLSSVTLAELLFGIRALPAGKRKDRLTVAWMVCWSCSGTGSCRSTPTRPGTTPN